MMTTENRPDPVGGDGTSPGSDTPRTAATRTASTGASPTSWWRGRRELLMVAVLVALGALLLIGTTTMNVLGDSLPGPQFFPVIVGVLTLLTALALAVDVVRNPESPRDMEEEGFRGDFSAEMLHDISGLPGPGEAGAPTAIIAAVKVDDVKAAIDEADRTDEEREAAAAAAKNPSSDLKTLGLVLLSMIVFVTILRYVGWVISAAALFWVVSRLLGSKRPILDIGIALLTSSVIQLIFGGLLGLSLPALLSGGSL